MDPARFGPDLVCVRHQLPATMKRSFFLIMASVLFVGTAFAQEPAAGQSSEVLQSCLLGTTDDTWLALNLTRDQLKRVHRVQEACQDECERAGVVKQDNPISNADGRLVMSELDNILSDDQYSAWVAYCAGITK